MKVSQGEMKEDWAELIETVRVETDTTCRLACRSEDLVVWIREPLWSGSRAPRILDFWKMRDGEFVLLTNRLCDLPSWFRLRPEEFLGRAACEILEVLNSGEYLFPETPIDGPNIWRARSGDRIAWVRNPHSWRSRPEHFMTLYDFYSCAAIIGESPGSKLDEMISFGGVEEEEPLVGLHLRCAITAAYRAGVPRRGAVTWGIGA